MSRAEVTKPNPKAAAKPSRSLAKGIAAGLIGGLAGAVAMAFAERIFASRSHTDPAPAGLPPKPAAARALGLPGSTDVIPWSYGAVTGAAYGALAEYFPAATSKEGASFGMTLEALTQRGAIPALGVIARERGGSAPVRGSSRRDRASEFTAHVVYGVTTEWVRRLVRRMM